MIDELYSNRILALAANMPRAGRLSAPQASVEKVAKLCGSRIVVDLDLTNGLVSDFAQEVQACALGQASAAILGANIIGAKVEEIAKARNALWSMLKEAGPAPEGRFADLGILAAVRDYPARHASTLLAFEAALAAVTQAQGLE